MSKPKSNSILDALPANQSAQLEEWLFVENISYKDAADRLLKDCNVRCAPSSLADWYQRMAQRRMLDRIAASRSSANEVVAKFRENPADMYQVLLDMVGQMAFEASMDGKKFDAEMIFNFTKLVMTARKQELEAQTLSLNVRRVELLEKKAAAFDQARVVLDSKLSPDEQKKRLKEILK